MKINDLMRLDYTKSDDKETLRKKILETPMFKNKTIGVDTLEKVYFQFIKKYAIAVSSFMPSINATYAVFISDNNKKENVKVISAKSYEEALIKALIYMHAYCVNTKGMKI